MTDVRFDRVSHTYPGRIPALDDVSLSLNAGECLVLLGPTGSGKSTILRLLAGLETPTGGRISFDGVDVTNTDPAHRRAALVSQRHLLYPHLTVRDNLAFGLQRPDLPAIITRLALDGLLFRLPAQLSGGQIQRVALGRALARNVRLLLLDEPFGHLDPGTRWELLVELDLLRGGGRSTMIFVTHEQEEAFALGDQVAILDAGRLLQVGPPREVYSRPATVTAARLLGWPPLNVLRGTLRADDAGVRLDRPACPVPLPSPLQSWRRLEGRDVLLGFRADSGLPLPLAGGRVIPGPSSGWLVAPLGAERVVVKEGFTPFDPTRVHLFDAVSGKALAHGAGP